MTVRVRKPAVDIVEKLSELDKPSGIAGEAMLRAETPQEQFNLIGAGRKNLLINGGFDIWQRGDVQNNLPVGTYYSADRWHGYSLSTGRTYSKDTTEALSIGFKNCLKAINGSAAPSFYQKVEDVRTAAGSHVTLSFWIKSNVEHSPTPQKISQIFGSGGSGEVAMTVPAIKITTEWTYHTMTVYLPSVENKTIGEGSYILVYPFTLDASKTYWTTGWQLEVGTVATPFEHRSYGEELDLCQRYYQFIGGSSYQGLAQGLHYQAGTATMANMNFIKEMRTAPSISIRGDIIVTNRVSYDDPVTGLAGIASGKSSAFARFNTGITRLNDSPQLVAVANGADGGLELNAEL